MRKAERMEADGAKDGDAQVCAFMGISSSEREMSQLSLDDKVSHRNLTVDFFVLSRDAFLELSD